jgi:hypothetical protein
MLDVGKYKQNLGNCHITDNQITELAKKDWPQLFKLTLCKH